MVGIISAGFSWKNNRSHSLVVLKSEFIEKVEGARSLINVETFWWIIQKTRWMNMAKAAPGFRLPYLFYHSVLW